MTSVFRIQRVSRRAEYLFVYAGSRKHSSKNLTYFYRSREASKPALSRVGITVPRALGGAVLRNRIKRRVRMAARIALPTLPAGTDLILHPHPAIAVMPYSALVRELEEVCARVARRIAEGADNTPQPRPSRGSRRPRLSPAPKGSTA